MANGNKPVGIGAVAQAAIIKYLKVKALEEQLKVAKAEYDAARMNALDHYIEQGVDLMHYRGFTTFLHQQDLASLVNGEDGTKDNAHKALKKNGLGWMVKPTVSPKTLSSWVSEQPVDEKTMEHILPEALKPFIKIFRKKEIRIRKKA